jgi:hypothetical protein
MAARRIIDRVISELEPSTPGENAMAIRTTAAGLLLLCALGALSPGARAETADDRAACTDDVHEHCGEFIPNRDEIILCLKRKLKVISPACRKVMTRAPIVRNQ